MINFHLYDPNLFEKIREGKRLYSDLISRHSEHECMLDGCKENAILSHTISKNFLSLIAENNHVICPELDINDIGNSEEDNAKSTAHNLQFKKTGINIAGTFKGFCSKHDNNLFESLDNNGIMTEMDIFLQVFRSLCFSYFKTYYVSISEEKTFGYQYHANTDFENMQCLSQKDLLEILFDYIQSCLNLSLKILPEERNNPLVIQPYEDGRFHDFVFLYRRLPTYFDFALENDITFKMNEKFHHCIVTLFPQKEYTNLIILCHSEINDFIRHFLYDEIDTLNFLESVLMLDSMFFIKPSEYESWSEIKKKIILDDYYFCNERTKFYESYDISIFDNIPKIICFNNNDEKHQKELNKVGYIPERPSFNERNLKQAWDFIKTRNKKLEALGNKSGRNYPHGPFIFDD